MKTLTIATAGYNEENNVQSFLESVQNQIIPAGYDLVEVLFVSDGSTDRTDIIVKKYGKKWNKLNLLVDGKNKGKSQRLNEIFSKVNTDLLVLFDADVILSNNNTVSELLNAMGPEVSLVTGNPRMIAPITGFEEVMKISDELQYNLKKKSDYSGSVYSCHGRVLGMDKSLYKDIKVPVGAVGNDAYIYFVNKCNGGGFKWVESAEVMFKMPSNKQDYLKQRTRHEKATTDHVGNFPALNISDEYKVDAFTQIKLIIQIVIGNSPIKIAQFICLKVLPQKSLGTLSGGWDVSSSTK